MGRSAVDLVSWPPRRLDFAAYGGDVVAFVADIETEPALQDLVGVVDGAGAAWVVVAGTVSQGDPAADEPWRGLQQPQYIDSVLVPRSEAGALVHHVPRLQSSTHIDLVDTHGHVDCCWVRESGRSPRDCPHYHRDFREVAIDDRAYHVVDTVERVIWEPGLLDCSIENGVRVITPSSFVQQRAELVMGDDGPAWWADGEPVWIYARDRNDKHEALLVRRDWLLAFLTKHQVELILIQQHIRWAVPGWADGGRGKDDPGIAVYSAGRLDRDGRLSLAISIREPR